MAAVELRDTGVPIVDIALKYGFSDQTTFTRSFKSVYGCAPSAYRKWPKPLPLVCKKMLLEPFKKKEGETDMGNLSKPYVHLEYIPAHKYLGIYKRFVTGEGEIWPGHDCDLGCGIISSFKEEASLKRSSQGGSPKKGTTIRAPNSGSKKRIARSISQSQRLNHL